MLHHSINRNSSFILSVMVKSQCFLFCLCCPFLRSLLASSLSSSFLGTATNALASLSNLSKDWLVLESIRSVGLFIPRRLFASPFVKGKALASDRHSNLNEPSSR